MYFARLLRSAGLPVGSGRVLDAISAVKLIGVGPQDDFYSCLFSLFVSRKDQRELFDQAFHIFWRNPKFMERMMGAGPGNESSEAREDMDQVEFDAAFTVSDKEVLQEKDFEQMSAAEIEEAKRAIAKLRLPIIDVPTRRFKQANDGKQVDMRASLRAALRSGEGIPLKFKKPRRRKPPLVILCDISGSMDRYSRMFLRFMHAITNDRDRVYGFVFGTRLTHITRQLRHRDIDVALEKATDTVKDWSGGTRIGQCLKQFNRTWSRRVLGQGAITLIISDGLDRDEAEGLDKEMERLAKSTRRLIWLNPLLRYDGFEPKASGIKAMLPHVDDFRSVHNLNSPELSGRTVQCIESVEERSMLRARGQEA